MDIKNGTRIRWAGDFSNNARAGTVRLVSDGYMFVQWDGSPSTERVPVALMSTPRWSVVA